MLAFAPPSASLSCRLWHCFVPQGFGEERYYTGGDSGLYIGGWHQSRCGHPGTEVDDDSSMVRAIYWGSLDGGPRLGVGTTAPVTAGGDGRVPASGGGGQVAGDWWYLLVGGVRLRAGLSNTVNILHLIC